MGQDLIRKRPEWARLVEAAYEPAEDDEAWAGRLTSLGDKVFGRANLFGVTLLRHDAKCASADCLLALGVPPAFRDALVNAFGALGPFVARELFYPRGLAMTLLEICGRLPPHAREYMAGLSKSWGVADSMNLCVHPEPGLAMAFTAAHDRALAVTPRERRFFSQIALHVETSYRLRRRGTDGVMAVISPEGKVLHREKDAPTTAAMQAHVARMERARTRRHRSSADGVDLWRALVDGRAALVARVEGTRRHYLVVENAPASQPIRALSREELDVVSYAARGLSAKLVAYGLGIAEPTVSNRLSTAASKLGLATRMELVRIAAMLTRDPRARFQDIALTTAERDVLALLAQGLSNRDIAAIRSRSVRTIANQVAKLLQKTKSPSRRALATMVP